MSDAQKTTGIFAMTRPGILAHPTLFTPKPFKGKNGKEKGEPKFASSIVLDTDHPDLAGIKSVIAAVARAAKPDVDLKTLKTPLANGTVLADKRKASRGDKYTGEAEFQRGKAVVIARSKFAPGLSVLENGKIIEITDDVLKAKYKDKFFFGAEALAEWNFVWYDAVDEGGKPGVTAYLNKILVTGKGTRIAGGRSAADAFSGFAGALSAEDPTGGYSQEDDWSAV